MATVKLAILLIRTVAKPISNRLKHEATQHPKFREFCVELAQRLYRAEVKLRTNILGEPAKHVRPLSETRAIENGANALAEGFLFSVAAVLIVSETWRTSRNQSRRRDDVENRLDELAAQLGELGSRVDAFAQAWEGRLTEERQRNDYLARMLERVADAGLRSGWSELQDTPLRVPRIHLPPRPGRESDAPASSGEGTDAPQSTRPPSNDALPEEKNDQGGPGRS